MERAAARTLRMGRATRARTEAADEAQRVLSDPTHELYIARERVNDLEEWLAIADDRMRSNISELERRALARAYALNRHELRVQMQELHALTAQYVHGATAAARAPPRRRRRARAVRGRGKRPREAGVVDLTNEAPAVVDLTVDPADVSVKPVDLSVEPPPYVVDLSGPTEKENRWKQYDAMKRAIIARSDARAPEGETEEQAQMRRTDAITEASIADTERVHPEAMMIARNAFTRAKLERAPYLPSAGASDVQFTLQGKDPLCMYHSLQTLAGHAAPALYGVDDSLQLASNMPSNTLELLDPANKFNQALRLAGVNPESGHIIQMPPENFVLDPSKRYLLGLMNGKDDPSPQGHAIVVKGNRVYDSAMHTFVWQHENLGAHPPVATVGDVVKLTKGGGPRNLMPGRIVFSLIEFDHAPATGKPTQYLNQRGTSHAGSGRPRRG